MRILYLTGDTRVRASAFSLFLPLYRELKKTGCVDICEFNAMKIHGDKYKKHLMEVGDLPKMRKARKILDPSYINNTFDIIFLENPFPYWYEDWYKIKPKRILMLGDLHRLAPIGGKWPHFFDECENHIGELSAIFTKYAGSYYRKHYKSLDIPYYHWPHSADIETFHDYGLKKKYGVLSTGVLASGVYPLRAELHKLFKSKSYYKRIDRPKNRTDKFPNPWPVGKDYAKELNKAKISIACTSKFGYTLAKLFEIPACKSVLLCDYTDEMKSLGFIPEVNFLQVPNNNIVQYVEDMLNSKKIHEINNNGYDLIRSRHTINNRVDEFLSYCKEVING